MNSSLAICYLRNFNAKYVAQTPCNNGGMMFYTINTLIVTYCILSLVYVYKFRGQERFLKTFQNICGLANFCASQCIFVSEYWKKRP